MALGYNVVLQQAAAIAQLQQLKQQLQQRQKQQQQRQQQKQQQQQQKQQQQQQQTVNVGATTATPTPQRVVTTMSILGQGQAQPRVMARGKQSHCLSVYILRLVIL